MRENGELMSYEMIVGLAVSDQDAYAQYRAEMTPLLEQGGGTFRYDFDVSSERKPGGDPDINRVFVIAFPNQAAKEAFFADPRYIDIRTRLFTRAVARVERIAEYERT